MNLIKKLFNFVKPEQREFVLRDVRVRVTDDHSLVLRINSEDQHDYQVMNISVSGLAIAHANLEAEKTRVRILKGELRIDQNSFPVEVELKHFTPPTAGCRFVNPDLKLITAIKQYFEAEITALNLKPIDSAMLKTNPGEQVLWFTNGTDDELYLVTNSAQEILQFHIKYLGNFIESTTGNKIRYARVERDIESANKPSAKSREILKYSDDIPVGAIEMACKIIQNIESADQTKLELILNRLQKYS